VIHDAMNTGILLALVGAALYLSLMPYMTGDE
jgi:hypothetical protein